MSLNVELLNANLLAGDLHNIRQNVDSGLTSRIERIPKTVQG